jgi:hypothetical protein
LVSLFLAEFSLADLTMTNDVVWSFGFDEVAGYTVDRDLLDGDPRKIEYVDVTPEKGDNPLFKPGRLYSGRPVKPEHVPTRIKWSNKKHSPYDVFTLQGFIVVSEEFKKLSSVMSLMYISFFQ